MKTKNFITVKNNLVKEQTHYHISPKIVRTDMTSPVTITPLYPRLRFTAEEYRVVRYPVCEHPDNAVMISSVPVNGSLVFDIPFGAEQEYNIILEAKNEDSSYRQIACFYIYAVDDDIYGRIPMRGDMHLHSYRSDGQEDPSYIPFAYRRMGFDYIALTDHGQYTPSEEMIEPYKDSDMDMLLFNGEEVHARYNPVHIINFGGKYSINKIFNEEPDRYYNEVNEIQKTVTDYPGNDAKEIFLYSSCKWVFDRIREAGGISIFCHPYWRVGSGYHIPERLTDYILRKRDFDAYEVVGGYDPSEADSNVIQEAKYYDLRFQGIDLPIVGVSDSHGCERDLYCGWYSTVALVRERSLDGIKEAISNGFTTAVETLQNEVPRITGTHRMTKLTYFILREVFPMAGVHCQADAAAMYAVSIGDSTGKKLLSEMKGWTDKYYADIYGE